jgi:ribokinase
MKSKPIVVVGSLNLDLVAQVERIPAKGETLPGRDFRTYPGGKGANQAVAAARLGYPVSMIGRVGSDVFGENLRESLATAGVDTSAIATSDAPSGVAMIAVEAGGDNSIIVSPGANACLNPADLDLHVELLRGAAMVLAQLEIPLATVEHLAAICARAGVPLILDPAPARELPASLWRNTAWITPNGTEARQLCGRQDTAKSEEELLETIECLTVRGARNILLKLGERGAYIASYDGFRAHIPAYAVAAVDTTAAGDAFNAAFGVALARDADPHEAANFAAAVAAISVTRSGAQSSMPTLAEVEQFLAEHRAERQELTI